MSSARATLKEDAVMSTLLNVCVSLGQQISPYYVDHRLAAAFHLKKQMIGLNRL